MSKKKKASEQKSEQKPTERMIGYTPEVKYGIQVPHGRCTRGSRIVDLLHKLPVTPEDAKPEEAAYYEVPATQVPYWRTVAKREGFTTTARRKERITGNASDSGMVLIWRH